jgi:hypothetical protein
MSAAKRQRTARLQVILHADELAALDDFQFKVRIPSRAAAVRELLRRGLAAAAIRGNAAQRPRAPKR